MPTDRYTRVVLTVIAGALLYLCAVLTPWPIASAQHAGIRPGDYTGPAEVVIVGAKLDNAPLSVRTVGQVEVTGTVIAQQRRGDVDRVLLTGWEERSAPSRQVVAREFGPTEGLPTSVVESTDRKR